MICPDCGTEMKPLATSLYCPRDCDRPKTETKTFEQEMDEAFAEWCSDNDDCLVLAPESFVFPTSTIDHLIDEDDLIVLSTT